MAEELILYTNPMSRGRIARWMMEEAGQPYRAEIVAYADVKSPGYLAVNRMGKLPALRHGSAVVTETAAICAYMADAFPAAGLAPAPGTPARAAYYRWLFFAAGPIEAAAINGALGFEVPPDRQRMAGYGSMAAVLDTIEAAVADRAYLAGDRFSAADVYFGSQIGWGLQFGWLERRPAIEAYWAGLAERPACKRAAELDDAEAAKQA